MIGVVTRTSAEGVYVRIESILPGTELGPLRAVKTRTIGPSNTEYQSVYAAGDHVLVIEDTPDDFLVVGVLD